MLALFRLFLKQSLFIHLICFILSLLWIGACKIIEAPAELNFARICPLFAMATLVFPAMNLTWIKSLPISKNALIAFNSANFFLNLSLTGLSLWIINKIIDRMFIIKGVIENSEAAAISGPVSFSTAIIIVSITLFLASLSFLIPGRIAFTSSNLNIKDLPKRGLFILAVKVAVISVLIFLSTCGYINQHILLTWAMVSIPGAIIAWTLISVGMPKNLYKTWLASFVSLGLAGSFFVTATAIDNLKSENAAHKVAAT